MGMLSLQGPKSRKILQNLTDADLSNEGFPFNSCRYIKVAVGHEVLALRVSFVGEMGWELHIPADSCVAVYRAIMEAGKPLGLVNAGYRAIGKKHAFVIFSSELVLRMEFICYIFPAKKLEFLNSFSHSFCHPYGILNPLESRYDPFSYLLKAEYQSYNLNVCKK